MAAWPGSLPQYHEIGLQETRQQAFVRTQMDTGPYKQRKRFTAATRFLEGTMLMTKAQKAIFDTFYNTTINEGADEFDFTDPKDGSTTQSVRFTAPPTVTALIGGSSGVDFYRATISLEILP